MNEVAVKLKNNGYKIIIGSKILPQLPAALSALHIGRDAVIITDKFVAKFHGRWVEAVLKAQGFSVKTFVVAVGEKSKSASVAVRLIEDIARYDVDKKIFVIALGGGVVGDLAGFVAAVYKRGVPYVQVPTTLLAQIDSAIGGKVGIDLTVGKNLAGAFYQPRLVFSDVSFLSTLDERQIRNGLAEAVKYGVIIDHKLFEFLEENHQLFLRLDPDVLIKVVLQCSRIKADVVSKDEREILGLRVILNFGHTLGHAVESAGGYQYHHGEAVALGMRMASYISCQQGMFSIEDAIRINQLLSNIGLPEKIEGVSCSKILSAMSHDKKFIAGKNRFILAHKIGKVSVVSEIPLSVIKRSIDLYSR